VEVDDAAVARKAFAELSLSNPCAYAIVTTNNIRKRWTRERIDNFRECCRKAGFDCPVSHFPGETEKQRDARPALMKAWAAALPHRCATLFGGRRRNFQVTFASTTVYNQFIIF
jgi:DNA-binding LacI/PurR family transcriptional regulator